MKRHAWIDDQVGKKFGALLVLRTTRTSRGLMALVRCDCGTEKTTEPGNLKSGASRSCGCMKPEKSRAAATRHGHSSEPEFGAWVQMLGRCLNPKNQAYPLYGARGISVCPRWKTYEKFLADMGRRPSTKHSLDRIDNDRGYEPGNCRWTDHQTQMNNTRRNVVIEHDGRSQTVAQWAREIGVSERALRNRLNRGWSVADALTAPVQRHAAAGTFDKQRYMREYRARRKARVYGPPVGVPR